MHREDDSRKHGATAVEYALLVTFTAAITFGAVAALGDIPPRPYSSVLLTVEGSQITG